MWLPEAEETEHVRVDSDDAMRVVFFVVEKDEFSFVKRKWKRKNKFRR